MTAETAEPLTGKSAGAKCLNIDLLIASTSLIFLLIYAVKLMTE